MRVRLPTQTGWLAMALAVISFAAVFAAQRESGVARDEVDYMAAGQKAASFWIDLFAFKDDVRSGKNITAHFGGPRATDNNREHPPLQKSLFGLSQRLFSPSGLGWMSRLSAARLPTVLENALLVVLVFLFANALWGRAEGLVAALLTLFAPRAFFHAGLATFDASVVTLWMATVFAYYKALDSRRWCVVLGIVYGLALATKHNAVFLPVPLIAHYVAISVIAAVRGSERGAGFGAVLAASGQKMWGRRPLIFLALALLGPAVLVASWPWLWFDTLAHARQWIVFHLEHVHYNFEYLGANWNAPPFPIHVPIVTTLLTLPVVTLVGAAIGAIVLAVRARRGTGVEASRAPALLLFLSAGAAMGPFILRTTPIFGAEKHFAAAFPTLAIFAAVGIVFAARRVARRISWYAPLRFHKRLDAISVIVLGALAIGAAAAETVAATPYALSHYNALAGGAAGGADFGMNRQFWGVAARGVLPVINELAAQSGPGPITVYAHDADKTFGIYKELGLLDPRIRVGAREMAGITASTIAIVIHERHFNRHDYLIWQAYGSVTPVFVLRARGVPIVSVYARPQANKMP